MIRRRKRTSRDWRYLGYVRSLPCAVCGRRGVEAAHTRALGGRGLGQKAPDRSCIPLCRGCHRWKQDSYHSITPEYRWAERHGIDLQELVARLNAAYDSLPKRGPVWVETETDAEAVA